jgi:glycosyltransferase involved in cell wall biosynthesis
VRVVQVTDFGSPFAGSFAPMLRASLLEARSRGWPALAVLPERARERPWLTDLSADGLEVEFAPAGTQLELWTWLKRLVAAQPGPTVLHSHFNLFDLPSAAISRSRPDVRTFWHVHTVFSHDRYYRARNRVKLALAGRLPERILCVAPHLALEARARGAPTAKLTYFPNGIDVDAHPPPSADERRAARAELGLPPDGPVLLHFGRAWELKGGDLCVRSLKLLVERWRGDVVLLAARGGQSARDLAAQLGVERHVVTVDSVERVQLLYSSADLLMATSRGEGMPLSVLEAMASGLPVVASDIPGHALGDETPPNLRIVPLEPNLLADAAAALLGRSPALAEGEALRAREWVRENMGLDRWAERLMDLYAGVPPPPGP